MTQETEIIPKIHAALKVLEKYASNLLKEESERHHHWQKINFTSKAFNFVRPLSSNRKILHDIGYTMDLKNDRDEVGGVSFEEGKKPNTRKVEDYALDLCIAKFEVRAITQRIHPRMKNLKDVDGIPNSFFVVSDSMSDKYDANAKQSFELLLTNTTAPAQPGQAKVYDDDEKPPDSPVQGL